jgi:DNA-binding transcriptional MerR regulator/effector-binding domain-containing protein
MKDQDLLSIREFSKFTGIKQSKLRYYDELKLFHPIKRGKNGYRYYSAQQAIAVNVVNVVHSLKIPLKEIVAFRTKRNPGQILEVLQRHELALNQELYRLQQAYSLLHTYSGLIQEGLLADEQNIGVHKMAAMPIELGSVNDFSSGFIYDSFFKFLGLINERNIDSAYPAGGFYENMDAFINSPGQPTRYFVHFPTGRNTKDAGEYLVGYTRGYYGNLGDLPQRMQSHAKEHGLSLSGPVYEIYLHDEIAIDDPNQYLIQASISVKKRKSRIQA